MKAWNPDAFTDKNYVLSFFTKGEEANSRKIVKNQRFIKGFQEIVLSLEIPLELLDGFSCSLVKKVTSKMFSKIVATKKTTRPPFASPCNSVLKYNVLRAVFVAKLQWSTPTTWIEYTDITDFGWDIERKPKWVDKVWKCYWFTPQQT